MILALTSAVGGCAERAAAPPPAAAAGSPGPGQMYVSADIGPPEVIADWTGYGMKVTVGAENAGHYDFATELEARTFLADSWKRDRTKTDRHDAYLDALVAVQDAGFMPEYVLAYLTHEGWTISGE